MKRIQNIGCDEKADKCGHDESMVFDFVFGELCHYLMTMERGPHNCGGIVHSGTTQLVPPHNTGLIQDIKNMPQLVKYKGDNIFL